MDTNYDNFFTDLPESKLELLDGRLIVGNGLDGSRLLLRQILRGWGAEAAVSLGAHEQWIEALHTAYGFAHPFNGSLELLEQEAARVTYQTPDLSRGREGQDDGQRQMRSNLSFGLHGLLTVLGGHALGRDFAMKLGGDVFSPDLLYFKGERLNKLHEYYLDGPAELVIEVALPAHRHYDCEIKRELYARGGVPEYVIIDPGRRAVEFHRLTNGDYRLTPPDGDGRYRPVSVPGLAIVIEDLWSEDDYFAADKRPFVLEPPVATPPAGGRSERGLGWGSLPFRPRLSPHSENIRFEEFISWCPEAKFEGVGGRLEICGRRGTRDLTGMLAMSLGMIEVCRLLPPLDWVSALKTAGARLVRQPEIRDEWWRKARAVAAKLRETFGFKRLGVTGDLLDASPLNYWSELELVIWEMPRGRDYEVYEVVSGYEDESTPEIIFLDAASHYFQEQLKTSGMQIEEL